MPGARWSQLPLSATGWGRRGVDSHNPGLLEGTGRPQKRWSRTAQGRQLKVPAPVNTETWRSGLWNQTSVCRIIPDWCFKSLKYLLRGSFLAVHIQRLWYAFTETLHIYVYYDRKVLYTFTEHDRVQAPGTHMLKLSVGTSVHCFSSLSFLASCMKDGEEEFRGLFQFLYSVYWKLHTPTSPSECTKQLAHGFIYSLKKYWALITWVLLGMELTRQTQAWEASSCPPESSLGRKVRCNLKIRDGASNSSVGFTE